MRLEKIIESAIAGRTDFGKLELYYEKEHRLDALGVTLPENTRVLEMVSAFPKLSVDVLVEVLNVEGFTLKDDDSTPELLWTWWQANNLDTANHLGMTEALVQGQAFGIVGSGTAEVPRFTYHTAKNIRVWRNVFGEVEGAVVAHQLDDEDEWIIHVYTPGWRQEYRKLNGNWNRYGPKTSTETQYVPVVPLTNQMRLKDKFGRSEMLEVIDLADAESRSLTNLQVAQELLALPQRYLFANGIDKFKDQNGQPIDKFKAYMAAIWTGPEGAQAGQFPGADLQQIINVVKLYGQKVSSITGIPPSMLGISTDNPASAEAMRAAKDRLITKGEFKQHLFGDSIEELMKIGLDMYGKTPKKGIETLETNWRDVATPSKSSKSANILQAHSQGLITSHTARGHLELTPEERSYEDKHESDIGDLARTIGVTPQRPAPRPSEAK